MKYALLIYESPGSHDPLTDDEQNAVYAGR